MSWEHVKLAFEVKTETHTAKLVLLAIAQHADSKTGACHPGRRRIAKMCGLCIRSVATHIGELKRAGLLIIVQRPGEGHEYVLNLTDTSANGAPPPMQTVHHPSANPAPVPVQTVPQVTNLSSESIIESRAGDSKGSRWFPEGLRTDRFKRQWGDWEEHLRQSNKPITNGTRTAQLSDCQRAGEDRSVIVILHAIGKGWKSLVWDFDRTHEQKHRHGKLREQDKRPIIKLGNGHRS